MVCHLLFIKLFPITILYLIILAFQIRVTSPPIPCLIMSSHFILIAFDPIHMIMHEQKEIIFKDYWKLRLDMKIFLSLYQALNLDLVWTYLPPYCASTKLKFIHVAVLDYISALYPILLIFLTWLCIELHDHNFRPIVWLWRPFHRCFVRLRRGWDTKSDIIDVFTTFFFLTYSKILNQTVLLLSSKQITHIELSGKHFLTYVSAVDSSVKAGGRYHLPFAISGLLISAIFNILPPLVLILYPTRVFRKCLSKCHLNFVSITIFLDKVYGCYRNGLDGGRDMRSFSGLYFFLQVIPWVISAVIHLISMSSYVSTGFAMGTLIFVIILVVTIGKPYQKVYMNLLDTLILSNIMILSYALSSGFRNPIIAQTLIAMPITVFVVAIILKIMYMCRLHIMCHKLKLLYSLSGCNTTSETNKNTAVNTPTSSQPLLQPTSTVFSYHTT